MADETNDLREQVAALTRRLQVVEDTPAARAAKAKVAEAARAAREAQDRQRALQADHEEVRRARSLGPPIDLTRYEGNYQLCADGSLIQRWPEAGGLREQVVNDSAAERARRRLAYARMSVINEIALVHEQLDSAATVSAGAPPGYADNAQRVAAELTEKLRLLKERQALVEAQCAEDARQQEAAEREERERVWRQRAKALEPAGGAPAE
jgi:hypothetical protein